MTIKTDTVYAVRFGDKTLNSFSTAVYETDEAAIAAARVYRDARNTSEWGQAHNAPCRIVRCFSTKRVNPL